MISEDTPAIEFGFRHANDVDAGSFRHLSFLYVVSVPLKVFQPGFRLGFFLDDYDSAVVVRTALPSGP